MRIDVNKLRKVYVDGDNKNVVLNDMNMTIDEGDFIAIMGASGSGKTTFLNLVSSLMTPTAGSITYDGQDVSGLSDKHMSDIRKNKFGFVFQSDNLMNQLTIKNNILLPLKMSKQSAEEQEEKLNNVLKLLGIEQIINKYPRECSGGQCQRATISRALIKDADILFCDEPTGNLDFKNTSNFMEILYDLNQKGLQIVTTTHDPYVASYAKDVYFLENGNYIKHLHRTTSREEFYKEVCAANILE